VKAFFFSENNPSFTMAMKKLNLNLAKFLLHSVHKLATSNFFSFEKQ